MAVHAFFVGIGGHRSISILRVVFLARIGQRIIQGRTTVCADFHFGYSGTFPPKRRVSPYYCHSAKVLHFNQ